MIDWSQFHFLRPAWFAALVPLAALLWLLLRRRFGSRWETVCDAALLPFILLGSRERPRRWSLLAVLVCGVLAVTALAGPTWSRLPQPVFSTQTALVIALDLTHSMEAADVSPSRLVRARFKIADLLRQRQEGQLALLVYAGDAFTVVPLTDDSATIVSQLPAVTTDIMPVQGNRTDLALERAGELLRQAGRSQGDILLITDEVDEGRAMSKARALREEGYRVSVLGVGTEQGAPVAQPQGGFIKDERGEIVIATLDEAPMRRLAEGGGGVYLRLALDDSDLAALAQQFSVQPAAKEVSATQLKTDLWEDQGPWLLLLILPLAALAFRRGYVGVLLLALLPVPRPASALDWDGLWLRPDQQGMRALDSGDAGRAAQLFSDPGWKGAAHYRAGDYEAAAVALASATDPGSLYNRGNALARLGRYPEAIAAYNEVLMRDPGNADAKFNRDLLEKEVQKQAQQDSKDGGQQGAQRDEKRGAQGNSADKQQPESGDRSEEQSAKSSPPQDAKGSAAGEAQQAQGDKQETQAGQDNAAKDAATAEGQPKDQTSGQPPVQQANGRPADHNETQQQAGAPVASADSMPPDEKQQAAEQWLRRIPDDPGGLLRRKFLYQYQQRHGAVEPGEKSW